MLVLGRKTGQAILVGDRIKVVIVSVDKGYVRIGIDAPEDVKIFREELLEKKNEP